MNILYINHYAGSVSHGMEYRPYYLAREWGRLGHNVTIVASNISHLRSKNITIPKEQDYSTETMDGINYIWCKTPAYSGNGIKRVINIFTFLKQLKKLIPFFESGTTPRDTSKAMGGLSEFKFNIPDLVIASSTYPFDTKVAAQIAHKTKAKFIYEVHDLWPLTPIELSGMSRLHPYIWWMQRAENFGYRTADKVVSLLPKAASYMQKHGMAADKFVYIPNGVSVSDWQNEKSDLSKEHQDQIATIRCKFKFLIGYGGGIGESNALGCFLSAAKSEPGIACVLVGEGTNKKMLLKRVADEKLNNVFFLPAIQKAQIPDFLRQMDALYIGWNKLSIYRFGICPNKIFDYMLASKPIIHSVTAGNDLVTEAKCGISVAAEDVSAIARVLNEMAHCSTSDREWLGENGHNYVIKHHDYPTLAKRFLIECGLSNA